MLDLEGHHVDVQRLRVPFGGSYDGACESRVKECNLEVGLMEKEGGGEERERVGTGRRKDRESNFFSHFMFKSLTGLAILSAFEFCEISLYR